MKDNLNGIILCLLEAVVGILLLISPVTFTSGIIILAGIVLLAIGIIDIIKYFRMNAWEAAVSRTLARGAAALMAGLFCIFNYQWFLATFPVITSIYAVVILIVGLGKLQTMVDMIRIKNRKWYLAAANAAITIVCAAIILNNPFSSTAVLWGFTGISLIIEAILDIIMVICSSRAEKKD